ncbi:Hemojuvelin [Balamuthia mandrillaris]
MAACDETTAGACKREAEESYGPEPSWDDKRYCDWQVAFYGCVEANCGAGRDFFGPIYYNLYKERHCKNVPEWAKNQCHFRVHNNFTLSSFLCGSFGDPHLVRSYGASSPPALFTCRWEDRKALYLSDFVEVYFTNEVVDKGTGATVTTKVEVLTKTCLYENFVFSHDAPFPKSRKVIEGQPHALVLETIRGENGEEQSDLYLRGVATHLQVRKVNGSLAFGLRGQNSRVGAACEDLCGRWEIPINITDFANIAVRVPVQEAKAACKDIRDKRLQQACVFDVAVTGNVGFVSSTKAASKQLYSLRNETNEAFNNHFAGNIASPPHPISSLLSQRK